MPPVFLVFPMSPSCLSQHLSSAFLVRSLHVPCVSPVLNLGCTPPMVWSLTHPPHTHTHTYTHTHTPPPCGTQVLYCLHHYGKYQDKQRQLHIDTHKHPQVMEPAAISDAVADDAFFFADKRTIVLKSFQSSPPVEVAVPSPPADRLTAGPLYSARDSGMPTLIR